jgi:MFS family permease
MRVCGVRVRVSCSFWWGVWSDKVGRKRVLMVGMAGSLVSVLMFGLSVNFAWALITRTIHGLLNGNLAVARSYIGDVTDGTNQARAMSVTSLIYGLGVIRAFFVTPSFPFNRALPTVRVRRVSFGVCHSVCVVRCSGSDGGRLLVAANAEVRGAVPARHVPRRLPGAVPLLPPVLRLRSHLRHRHGSCFTPHRAHRAHRT